ncbi:hypothetical protein MBEHAL_1933 [Halarchaeum acidiphilum MH1-52-1]|uniref:Uncharacterized protein n=1 Tax=Halarchaeum acidiphilum MH1-52-1 TaxID=1261545 RepID=U3AEH1_9EURY|nr:hypothetical protein MBEHAL_1933 [Halarchaeum acidiphilum MH1-52-1]
MANPRSRPPPHSRPRPPLHPRPRRLRARDRARRAVRG